MPDPSNELRDKGIPENVPDLNDHRAETPMTLGIDYASMEAHIASLASLMRENPLEASLRARHEAEYMANVRRVAREMSAPQPQSWIFLRPTAEYGALGIPPEYLSGPPEARPMAGEPIRGPEPIRGQTQHIAAVDDVQFFDMVQGSEHPIRFIDTETRALPRHRVNRNGDAMAPDRNSNPDGEMTFSIPVRTEAAVHRIFGSPGRLFQTFYGGGPLTVSNRSKQEVEMAVNELRNAFAALQTHGLKVSTATCAICGKTFKPGVTKPCMHLKDISWAWEDSPHYERRKFSRYDMALGRHLRCNLDIKGPRQKPSKDQSFKAQQERLPAFAKGRRK